MGAEKKISGLGMFIVRYFFWLTTLVVLLPPAADGDPPPRVNLMHAALATQVLIEDVTGVCDRNPEACATSREAMALLGRKLETGADIVVAGIAASRNEQPVAAADHGTLTQADLEPAWSLSEIQP
jgi:hypothetical protein